MIENQLNIPFISGIDAVYYFAESGGYYDEKYIDILNKINRAKQEFEAFGIAYQESDVVISINDIDIQYSGKTRDGFHWFKHEFFRVGFKDGEKNKNIHDICIQLNAIGIYTLGIKSLIEYINTQFLEGYALKDAKFPITRIDVNMFVQHHFTYLKKEMVVSKKKDHTIIYSENTNSHEVETYYIGKKPFKLRIYNKLQELKTASQVKKDLMYNHFGVNGLNIKEPIWNIEFELHREFLKKYGIQTVEQALKRSNELFKLGCELVKFVDISSSSEKRIYSKNRRLLDTLPIWEYIRESYNNQEFLQLETPLHRVESISYRYGLEDAKKPILRAIKRLMLHSSTPTLNYLLGIIQEAKEDFALKRKIDYVHQEKEDLSAYSDEGLQRYEESLAFAMRQEEHDSQEYDELSALFQDVYDELVKRGLKEPIPF